MDLVLEIAAELRITLELLGVRPESIDVIMAAPGKMSGEMFRSFGADMYLACSIGSWCEGDLPAEKFLEELRQWNLLGPTELEPNLSYGKPTPPETETL